jgi:hypothetical protein
MPLLIPLERNGWPIMTRLSVIGVEPRIPQKNVTRVKWHQGYTTMNNLGMPSISNRNVSYV